MVVSSMDLSYVAESVDVGTIKDPDDPARGRTGIGGNHFHGATYPVFNADEWRVDPPDWVHSIPETPWENGVSVDMASWGPGNCREWFTLDTPVDTRKVE